MTGAEDPASGPERLRTLIDRLGDTRASVRRVAVIDLARLAHSESALAQDALAALLTRLERESDTRTALAIAHRLCDARYAPALPTLKKLYDDPATPADLAVEAIRAHDSIEAGKQKD